MAAAGAGPGDPNLPEIPDVALRRIARHLNPMDMRILSRTCRALRHFYGLHLRRQMPGLAKSYPRVAHFAPVAVGIGADDQLVSVTLDQRIAHTSLATGDPQVNFGPELIGGGPHIAMSGDCTRVVKGPLFSRGSDNYGTIVFNTRDGSTVRAVRADIDDLVYSVAINHGGTHFALSSTGRGALARSNWGQELPGTVSVFAVDDEGPPVILPGNGTPVHYIAINSDGTRVVTVRSDRTIQLWNGRTGDLIYMCDVDDEAPRPGPPGDPRADYGERQVFGPVSHVVLNHDDTQFATGDFNGVLCVRNTADGRQLFSRNMGFRAINKMAYNATGTRLAVSFHLPLGLVAVYDTRDFSRLCSFSPESIAVAGQEPHALDLVDFERFHVDAPTSIAFSPDGTLLATHSTDKVLVWHMGRCA